MAKAVVVVLAALVLVNAQCLATCAVQPCHSQPHKADPHGDKSNPCHKNSGSQGSDKQSGCTHESLSGDAAKKIITEQSPLLLAGAFVQHDLSTFSDTRVYAASEPLLLPTVTIASKTVLRI